MPRSDVDEVAAGRVARASLVLSGASLGLSILFTTMIRDDRTFRIPVVTWHPLASTTCLCALATGVAGIVLAIVSGNRVRVAGLLGLLAALLSLMLILMRLVSAYED